MILNRIGDFGLALALFFLYYFFSTGEYFVIFNLIPFFYAQVFLFNIYTIDLIGFFIFIGAIGKSAQIGLHT
jgi:NADH:ubiquinone oxidoreductase subunit 5 (subunit L)/multisubunit Na+/H+ antiporter MnhA subunit